VANLRATQKQMTRRLLLDHGLALFRTKGYAAATVDEIAAGAGTTRTTFYLHFPSKAHLVQALVEDARETMTEISEPSLTEVVERGERTPIEVWIGRRFDMWPRIGPQLRAAYQAATIEPEISAMLESWYEGTAAAMRAGLDRAGRFDPDTRHVRCMLAFGQLEFTARRWFESGWTFDRAVTLRTMTDSWCHLLTQERG
jgi:AcrR family transcriptional regulator